MSWRDGRLVAAALILLCASFAVDQPVARWMTGVGPHALGVFEFVTWFGQGGVILYPAAATMLAAAALGWAAPRLGSKARLVFRYSASVFAVVAVAGLVNDALKICFGRARPQLWLAGDQTGFHFLRYSARFASFPSGHTASSAAAAIILSALFPRGKWMFVAFAALIGLSRIVINAHYVSDVVAGAAVGIAVALKILDRLRKSGWTPVRNG